MASRLELRNNLLASLGLGPNMRRSSIDPLGASSPNVMDPLGISTPNRQGFGFRRGVMPSETDINRYLDSMTGTRPLSFRRQAPQRTGLPGRIGMTDRDREAARLAAEAGAQPGTSTFDQLVESYKSKIDEANAANEKRYKEMHDELSSLRTRNQDRVGNWGIAAQADINDRMQTALGNQRAELAARGLQNSSILPAFEGNIAQRTAREQQRVSEMRDSRASEYDTRDTNALVGAVERREDVAPDYGNLINLAMQYGRSGQGQGMDAVRDEIAGLKRQLAGRRYRPMTQLPMMPGPVGRAPIFLNPGAMFGGAGGGVQPFDISTTSNRRPTPRPGSDPFAGIIRNFDASEAKKARIAKRRAAKAAEEWADAVVPPARPVPPPPQAVPQRSFAFGDPVPTNYLNWY